MEWNGMKRGSNEVESASEAALDLDEFILTMRRIATKSKNILDSIGFDGFEGVIDLLNGHVGAGEMHHSLDTDDVLHLVGDV